MNNEQTSGIKQGAICSYYPKTEGLPVQVKVRVCGVALTEQPVIGRMYIVEVLDGTFPSAVYPYTHLVAPDCNLVETKGDKYEKRFDFSNADLLSIIRLFWIISNSQNEYNALGTYKACRALIEEYGLSEEHITAIVTGE